ncbi:hypothetical protein ACFUMH_08920 [Cellulomonas sp. NPDC057328]|uniref:hypothetical protein n=1 Tax=Cellulomonas sp. NPDC057328 TaxID=3346101 RepID=UPI00364014D8
MTQHRTARPTGGGSPAPVPHRATRTRRGRTVVVATAVAAVLALASACASTASAGESGTPTGTATQAGSTVRFGKPFEYADGLFLTVKAPQQFEPSGEAEGVEEGVPVRVRVQVTNGTRQPYTPSTLSATAESGGVTATPVWDPAREIDTAGPYVTLDPGGTASFDLGFAVADPSDLRIELLPALGGYDALVVTTD